ncbi:MAG TPA: hypothetical protein VGO07_05285 [Candidatus Saccharimonadales bacterium]|jgi:hypothetical protein|nr:hypothetical protein [Candidatus Saccharimonadales bacterium]
MNAETPFASEQDLLPRTPVVLGKRTAGFLSALLLLGGCSEAADQRARTDTVDNAQMQVTTYRGRDLKCLVTSYELTKASYDCDFDEFYADPKYAAPTDVPRIETDILHEVDSTRDGKSLHCLVFDLQGSRLGNTCDFPRYHNPNL